MKCSLYSVIVLSCLCCCVFGGLNVTQREGGWQEEEAVPQFLGDEMYPAFHVRPSKNWINDPNGPIRLPPEMGGVIHLWMQYNPFSAVWGNMSWWHVMSSDYVTWTPIGVSLTNNNSYDQKGVFSGSATMVDGIPVIMYTCNGPGGQLQCVARPADPTDPRLTQWVKDPTNPVIAEQLVDQQSNNFRDPTNYWLDPITKKYVVGIGASAKGPSPPGVDVTNWSIAVVPVYATTDLVHYEYSHDFFSDEWEPSGMFECPDFFTFDDEGVAVLKTSNEYDFQDYYRLGKYEEATLQFVESTTMTPVMIDWGNLYASKTFKDDNKQQRILWGWINEEDDHFADRGWAGAQSLPRRLSFHKATGKLVTAPISELAKLRQRLLYAATTAQPISVNKPLQLIPPSGRPMPEDANAAYFGDLECAQRAAYRHTFAEFGSGIEPLGVQLQQEIDVNISFSIGMFGSSMTNGTMSDGLLAPEVGLLIRQASGTVSTKVVLTKFAQAGAVLTNMIVPAMDFKDIPLGNASSTEEQNITACQNECERDRRCLAWSYVRNGFPGNEKPAAFAPRCALKSTVTAMIANESSNCCVSGFTSSPIIALVRGSSGSYGPTTPFVGRADVLSDGAGEGAMRLHVFNDHSFTEVFKDCGIEAISARLYVKGMNTAGVSVVANNLPDGAAAKLINASVWNVGSIWNPLVHNKDFV